jgi:hypothetical protein
MAALDTGPIYKGSLLCSTNFNGWQHVPYAETPANAHRSNASKYHAVYANSSYDIYARISLWIGSLLDSKQSTLYGSTVVCQPTDENKFKS